MTQGPWSFAECPCRLLLPSLTISAAANISHQWGKSNKNRRESVNLSNEADA